MSNATEGISAGSGGTGGCGAAPVVNPPPTNGQSSSNAQTRVALAGKNPLLWSSELSDFLTSLDSYKPTVPEAVTCYLMKKSGANTAQPRVAKLLSLAADKFLSEIIYEAKQFSKLRQQSVRSQKRRLEMSETLEMVDLESSLAQARIYLRRKKAKQDD